MNIISFLKIEQIYSLMKRDSGFESIVSINMNPPRQDMVVTMLHVQEDGRKH